MQTAKVILLIMLSFSFTVINLIYIFILALVSTEYLSLRHSYTDMDSKVAMCNAYNPDLVIDIHYNAGGGTGFEVYYLSLIHI